MPVDVDINAHHVVASADSHCGADLYGYRPYLEKSLWEEFDQWAATFSDGWGELEKGADAQEVGVASYANAINWESHERMRMVEQEGIVAEVLFPNTAPPFFPAGAVSAPSPARPPKDRREYELRFAGIRAHNRWLAEFCQDYPGRRAGMAQIFLSVVDDAVDEIHRAASEGLSGILLPGDHFEQLQNLYGRDLDPVWQAAQELDLPVVRHGVFAAEPNSHMNSYSSGLLGMFESKYFTQRSLASMTLSGVFERFPGLKFVLTEIGAAWAIDYCKSLDALVEEARKPGTIPHSFGAQAVASLSRKPSEYLATNCYLASFFTEEDMEAADAIGANRLMWGADFPHHEGTSPWTTEALRANFSDRSVADVRRMVGGNACECYGLDWDHLASVAQGVGPTVETVGRPLTAGERPDYPGQTVCATFR